MIKVLAIDDEPLALRQLTTYIKKVPFLELAGRIKAEGFDFLVSNVGGYFDPAIADRAIDRKIGARGLRSIMESVMTDVMYTVPSDPGIRQIIITEDSVRNGTEPEILRTKDLAG